MQGRLDEAKPLYEVSLRVRRKTLGNEHPEVADSLNNLGELLLTQVGRKWTFVNYIRHYYRDNRWLQSHCWKKPCLFGEKLMDSTMS